MKQYTERNNEIYQLRKQGKTLREIAARYKIGPERVRQIEIRKLRDLRNSKDPDCWWYGLSERTSNCLRNADINSKEEALEGLKNGKINFRMNGTKNYGWKCHIELHKWLGLPEPKKGGIMGEARRREQFMMQNGMQPGHQQQIKVDLSKSPPRACACGCKYFTQAVTVHTISALVSPTGQELTAQVPVLICLECKAMLSLEKKG